MRYLRQVGGLARAEQPAIVLLHAGTNDILHESDQVDTVLKRTIGEVGWITDTLRSVNPQVVVFVPGSFPTQTQAKPRKSAGSIRLFPSW